jgi:DUF1707 SHOCT-like domain
MGMEHDPNIPSRQPDLRASDAERAQIIELLRRHHQDGRLTAEELGERIERVNAATTFGDSMRAWRTCLGCCRLWRRPPRPYKNGRPGQPGKRSTALSSPTW